MRGEVHILVYCPIDTLQWGSTHSAMFNGIETAGLEVKVKKIIDFQVPNLLSYCLTSKRYRKEKCLRSPH